MKTIKIILKLAITYIAFSLLVFGICKICIIWNSSDNIIPIIGYIVIFIDSIYLGFRYRKNEYYETFKSYIAWGFVFIIIGAIISILTWILSQYVIFLLGGAIYNLMDAYKDITFDRGFFIYFILTQFNLLLFYNSAYKDIK